MTRRKILVADLLCGAGGSSTGAARALAELGLEMDLVCVNHWPTAIETHRRNHPEARHYVQDIATVRPHLLVPEGYLDLLMASPTCTHHSVARGGKPTSDQQRSDPWHIVTWLTELRVKRIIIENVWEFIGWGPVDVRTGKPVKSRKGEYFVAWTNALRALGFELEWRKLNAADYGDATTRQRFILKGRSDRKTIGWAPRTHVKRVDGADLFPGLQQWRPAREIIDWSIKGRSIYGRSKDLAPKTILRIYAGIDRHGWPREYVERLERHMASRGIAVPPATGAGHASKVVPLLMNGRRGNKARGVEDAPLPTLDTKGGVWLAEPDGLILSQHTSGSARSTDDPLPTITTGGAAAEDHPGCARPMLVTVAHGNSPGDATADRRRVHDIEAPLGSLPAGGNTFALVEPFVLSQASGGTARTVEEPIPTAPTDGAHALISPYYGSGSGETCVSADDPLPTVTAKARFGMVVPITHADGSNRARDVDDPLPTLTTANRGELAFITAQHGEREGQSPRVHDVAAPLPTIAATGHVDLAAPGERFDILFRMLEPHELAAAMGFTTDDATYEFAGTKTDQIKQIGNAVSVAMMKAEVRAIMADAAADARLREAAE